jgi:hypothetical protein
MYIYVNSPISAIVARARLESITTATRGELMGLLTDLCLQQSDVIDYLGRAAKVGLYRIGNIELANANLSVAELQNQMVFHPPQSFLFLSRDARELIDALGRFSRINTSLARQGNEG